MLLVPLVGCAESGGAGTCYLDAHCTASICVEGRCLSTIEAEEDSDAVDDTIRLDVGSGPTPEIPTSCAEARTVRTSAGCEFWAADLPNAWLPSEPYGHDTAAAQQFAVVVANVSDAQPATVSVYCTEVSLQGSTGDELERADRLHVLGVDLQCAALLGQEALLGHEHLEELDFAELERTLEHS